MSAPVFTTGSLMRHVIVMTVTGAIGLIAVFVVDALSLFWVSRLGDQTLKASIGYASQALFLLFSINIGLTIAVSATVSRALGAGDRFRARRLAASALTITFVITLILSALLFVFRDAMLANAMHAEGRAADIASRVLAIVIPSNVAMGLGLSLSGILRAAGDARRAMWVTLAGGFVTAVTDPLLIFGFGLGVYGAAWAIVISRLVYLGVGAWATLGRHHLVARPRLVEALRDLRPIMAIGLPAILANLATPVAAIYITRVWSDFGEATVAGGAIVDRVIPLAFGVIFALTGSIGPIIGQNFGARLLPRVQRTLSDALIVAVGYALCAWAALAALAPVVDAVYGASGASAEFIDLFCRFGALAWVFVTCLFVANTAFNNLGFPVLAMIFNRGRATLGTIPFIAVGAYWNGIPGALIGLVFGSAIFGVGAAAIAFALVARLAKEANSG
jgi:putative MATE family efflux protein